MGEGSWVPIMEDKIMTDEEIERFFKTRGIIYPIIFFGFLAAFLFISWTLYNHIWYFWWI